MRSLANTVILDLTHMPSGPFATMILTDLGAETIEVEPPGRGEGTRALLADDPRHSIAGMGAYFLANVLWASHGNSTKSYGEPHE